MIKRYYNRPEKTLEETSNLWFHVGDAMYYDEAGEYYFVDRMGHIIRKRGENLSSEQIEEAMNEAAWVAESAALPVEAAAGGEDEIAAVLLLADGEADDFSEAAFREFLAGKLPEVMRPDRVIIVDDLPMTDTNKVRKHELHERLFAE
jgi:crotonobetaine/carnitine-CoA ligase